MPQVETFLWVLARVAGLGATAALAISLLTGLALRSAVLDWLASNRAVRSTHEFTAVLWIPLGVLHVALLLLDASVSTPIRPLDVVVPFQVRYGTLAIGLGTVTLDLFVIVAVTGWLRRRVRGRLWQLAWPWIHRLSYVACALLFLHAALGGSDFSAPEVSAVAWSAAAILGVLSVARILWGRLSAEGKELAPSVSRPARTGGKRSGGRAGEPGESSS